MQSKHKAEFVDMELLPLVNHLDGWHPRRLPEPPEVVDEHEGDLWYDYSEADEQYTKYDYETFNEAVPDLETVKWTVELVNDEHSVEAASFVGWDDEEVMVYLLDVLLDEVDDPLGVWAECKENESSRSRLVNWFSSWMSFDEVITEYSGFKPEDYDEDNNQDERIAIETNGHIVIAHKER